MADFVVSPGAPSHRFLPPAPTHCRRAANGPTAPCFCLLDFHLNCLVTIARTSKVRRLRNQFGESIKHFDVSTDGRPLLCHSHNLTFLLHRWHAAEPKPAVLSFYAHEAGALLCFCGSTGNFDEPSLRRFKPENTFGVDEGFGTMMYG